ncbi:MAG: response regulator [Campylobacterales bacterium]
MYLLESSYFVESSGRRGSSDFIIRPLGQSRTFLALLDDASHTHLVREALDSLLSSEGAFSLRTLLALLGQKSSRWHQHRAHFAVFDAQLGDFQHFNLGAPPLLCKEESGRVVRLGQAVLGIESESIVIERLKTGDIASLLFTLDSGLATLMENHLPFCFSKKEILDVTARFTDEEEAGRFDFLFLNNEIGRNRRLSRRDAIEGNLEAIMGYEEKLETLLQKYLCDDLTAATNTLLIFNELIINALEHGALGIDQATKQQLMSEGAYESYIEERQAQVQAKLYVGIDFYSGGLLRVTITDEGEGFDYKNHLSRMDAVSVGTYRGRGLIMAAQMSAALFYSDGGRSVTFFMRFRGGEEKQAETLLGDEALLREMTVLYAEDDHFIRTHVAHLLKRAVRNLLLAENGKEALQLFERYRPDIVVTDVEMPLMGGLEMAEKIKEIDRDTPVIVTTAYNTEEFFIRAIDAGVDKFLSKPIRIPNLRRTLYDFARSVYLKNQAKEQLRLRDAQKESLIARLDAQNSYAISQQQAAFAKQRLVIRDDSHQLSGLKAEVYYEPLEILSGDVYGVLKLSDELTFFYIIDSMGKGLSASVTAILSAAFINRSARIAAEKENFVLERLTTDYIDYIRDYLLEDECVSFTLAALHRSAALLEWVGFGMYPMLLHDGQNTQMLEAGNPPLMLWSQGFKRQSRSLPENYLLIAYSDGAVENDGLDQAALGELIRENPGERLLIPAFKKRVKETGELGDDVTLICIESGKND